MVPWKDTKVIENLITHELFFILACSISNSHFRIIKEVTFSTTFLQALMPNIASEIHSDFFIFFVQISEEKPISISSKDHNYVHVIVL